jgi:hypothetical protein
MAQPPPLVSVEIPDFDLTSYLNTGGLPQLYGDPEAQVHEPFEIILF